MCPLMKGVHSMRRGMVVKTEYNSELSIKMNLLVGPIDTIIILMFLDQIRLPLL